MKNLFVLVAFTFILIASVLVHAETATLSSNADTWIRADESYNHGNAESMYLLGGTGRLGYIRFDLSALGSIEVTDAALTLTKVSGDWGRNDTMVTGRIGIVGLDNISGNTSQSWSETSLTSGNVGAEYVGTGTAYPINSALSTNLDADNGANVTENIDSYTKFTLTGNDLVDFLQARADDNGLATFIATFTSTDTKGFWLATKENDTASYRPVLQITYIPSRSAYSPTPGNGAAVTTDSLTELSWTPGYQAVRSEVYFGTDPTIVANTQKLVGDVDGNGSVDIDDISQMASQWLSVASTPCPDLDYSGLVDLFDFAQVSSDWQDISGDVYLGSTQGSTINIDTLDPALTYYWRVDTVTCDGIETGDVWDFQTEVPSLPAFPGAEGFGAMSNGGRGGDVYTVTNLNSSGAGSLRYGIENAPSQGRTIIFAVSGYIPISYNRDTGNQTVRIVQDNVTIAGQTAPGDGIALKDGRILVTGSNAVIRHIRIRHGKYGAAGDCINIESRANNTILDHVSLMFSTDENISFFNSAVDNFTMQYCTSSWGMERHNAGGLWDLENGTCHHCLWAHHRTRNPKARPYGLLEWINNVTCHWRSEGFIMGDSESNVDWYANIIGCYYVSIADYGTGLDSTAFSKGRIADNGRPNFHLYLDDTLIDANGDGILNGTDNGYGIISGLPYDPAEGAPTGAYRYYQANAPFTGSDIAVTTDDPLTAYKKVLSSSGALRLDASYSGLLRDELDDLLIESVENQESILVAKDSPVTSDPDEPPSNGEQHLADEYGITNNGFGTLNSTPAPTDTDGDGMPDFWEQAIGSSETTANNNMLVPSGAYVELGYTLLDEYLHFCAIPHASIPMSTASARSPLIVDLSRYTRGFNVAPVTFTVSNIKNGTAFILSGETVWFEPIQDFSGRASFDFTVTDGDGSTWTQTMAVLVKTE